MCVGVQFFGAHYRMVSQPDGSKRLIAFSAAEEGHDAMITLWEYDSDFKCLHKGKHTLKGESQRTFVLSCKWTSWIFS